LKSNPTRQFVVIIILLLVSRVFWGCGGESGVQNGECQAQDNHNPCEDGDLCTQEDFCLDGECISGTPKSCDDHDVCTKDACNPMDGQCAHQGCDPNASCTEVGCVCEQGFSGDGFGCAHQCPNQNCDEGEDVSTCPDDCDFDLVVVVQESMYDSIRTSLEQYLADIAIASQKAYVISFSTGDVNDLKNTLVEQFTLYGIEGAFLIGDLPHAEYEDSTNDQQFPCDIFLMDLDQSWTDGDEDGKLDGHPRSPLEIFVSRITGTSDEINKYLAKVHQYRTTGSLVPKEALVFMDSHTCDEPCAMGLDWIYSKTDYIDSFV